MATNSCLPPAADPDADAAADVDGDAPPVEGDALAPPDEHAPATTAAAATNAEMRFSLI
jgi:hypothetical protein